MKHTVKFLTVWLASFLILFNVSAAFGADGPWIEFIEKIEFSQKALHPVNPWDFCLTDDELFIIPDYREGNIKIYERNGNLLELIETIGRRGYHGQDSFVKPMFCFYEESKFGVLDNGMKKIFIYDRIGRVEFKRIKDIYCPKGATDIQLKDNRLFIAGYKVDPNSNEKYEFYSIDLEQTNPMFLLSSKDKYQLEASRGFMDQFNEKYIPAVGIKGFFDIYNNNAYFVWMGKLRVIKINILTGEKSSRPFGKQTNNYIEPKPIMLTELINAYYRADPNLIERERRKISVVRNVFSSSKGVIVFYDGPFSQEIKSGLWLQFYGLDGTPKGEAKVPGPIISQSDVKVSFDKQKNILYFFQRKSDGEGPYILEYKINDW